MSAPHRLVLLSNLTGPWKRKAIMKTIKTALAAALISGLSLSALSLQASASPYHQDRLPGGALTGPLQPDANGG
jgi:hypothetical protein